MFPDGVKAATSLKHVHIWWYENGEQQEWLNIQPSEHVTINRDVGTDIHIRIFQANDQQLDDD